MKRLIPWTAKTRNRILLVLILAVIAAAGGIPVKRCRASYLCCDHGGHFTVDHWYVAFHDTGPQYSDFDPLWEKEVLTKESAEMGEHICPSDERGPIQLVPYEWYGLYATSIVCGLGCRMHDRLKASARDGSEGNAAQ